jgi:tubulin-folding cofactor B
VCTCSHHFSRSVAGVEYFKARNQHASFVRPERVRVGDYPELDIADELGLDDDEEM